MTLFRNEHGDMDIKEIKSYIRAKFTERFAYDPFGQSDDDAQLNTTTLRYQYFGERMLHIYRHDLSNCYSRAHTWFLLEMVNPNIALHSASIKRSLEGLLKNPDTDLWDSAYGYYDHVGHSEFQPTLSSWLDKHRNELFIPEYDFV